MKQRITVEQLNELSEEQKQRLREWWKPLIGDWVSDKENVEGQLHIDLDTGDVVYDSYYNNLGYVWIEENIKAAVLPLLSIGQMIELLISLNLDGEKEQTINDGIMWMNEGLCDGLWSAVKQVL